LEEEEKDNKSSVSLYVHEVGQQEGTTGGDNRRTTGGDNRRGQQEGTTGGDNRRTTVTNSIGKERERTGELTP
jgi:hypothetical protein